MLSDKGFDLWADGYDQSVGLSDEEGSYPFAGYKALLNKIYNCILSSSGRKVLDIGFGTGTLSAKLYEQGCDIWGQDFSEKMMEIAQAKMPQAHLYCDDFSKGLSEEIEAETFDAIVATYSLHHLSDMQKVVFLRHLLTLLNKEGCIYIGDVAFQTREDLEECRNRAGNAWDEDEIYFVYEELHRKLPNLHFGKISDCAGLLTLHKE